MFGPVFELEWSRATQRGRLTLLRWSYAALLILELFVLRREQDQTIHDFAQSWLLWFLIQQFALLAVATPIFLAAGIGDEKLRGSLQFLLIADLTAAEIVLGKFLARTAQLVVLVSIGFPPLCFLAALGGYPLTTPLVIAVFTLAFIFALGAVSMLGSVWVRQTREAVLALLLIGAVLVGAGWGVRRLATGPPRPPPPALPTSTGMAELAPVYRALSHFSMFHLLAPAGPYPDPPELAVRLLLAGVLWSGVGAVCLGLAVWRLRPAYRKELEGRPRARSWLQRAPPTDEPVRWKEAHVERAVPIPIVGAIPGWLGSGVLFAALLLWSGYALVSKTDRRILLLQQSAGVLFFASLMVGIRASGAVTSEREHNTWETLLTTPLDTEEMLHGKLWGILDAMIPFLIAYGVFALIPSVVFRDPLTGGLTLLALGATWIAMYLLGAAGILASARAASSGQSLVSTLVTGYGLSNVRCCLSGPHATFLVASLFFVGAVAYPIATGQGEWNAMVFIGMAGLSATLALGPGLALWRRAQDYMDSAVIYVDRRERAQVKRRDELF